MQRFGRFWSIFLLPIASWAISGCGSSGSGQSDGGFRGRDAGGHVSRDAPPETPTIPYYIGGCETSSGVGDVSNNGGALPYGLTVVASGLTGVATLEVDATNAYFAAGASLSRLPLTGGGAPVTMINGATPVATAIDTTNIYWMDGTVSGQTTILYAPLTATGWNAYGGDAGTTATKLGAEPGSPGAFALANGYVYFAADSNVFRVSVGGGTIQPIATGIAPTGIAADTNQVYLGDGANEAIDSVALTGGPAGTPGGFAISYATPSQLALNGGNLYWGDWLGGIDVVPVAAPSSLQVFGTPCGGGACYPRHVRPGGTGAVWESGDQICSNIGTANTTGSTLFATALYSVNAIAADTAHLYAVTEHGQLLRWNL